MRNIFSNNYKWVLGQAKCETALSNADYPASSAYIDVSGTRAVHVMIHLGTLADAVVFKLQQVSSVSGTPATIDSTNLKKTVATTDDGQCLYFYLDVNELTTDSHFITVDVSGNSGSNYADIYFLLEAQHAPVTQTTTILPTDNVKSFGGVT